MFWYGGKSLGAEQSAAAISEAAAPQPDHAWKALSVTNEWIRHADSKAAVTLAFAGATATIVFNLVNGHTPGTCSLKVFACLSALAIVAAVISAGCALLPRVNRRRHGSRKTPGETLPSNDTVNLLFFGDVYRNYAESLPSYREDLVGLTSERTKLTEQIADQIHANARIAAVKFRWANRAIASELIAVLSAAATALLVATGW